jgi:hypothetical protein
MPLSKLFRVVDTEGQAWHVAAPSFASAVAAMREWENEPHGSDDEIVQSVHKVEDLILGGNREESLGSYTTLLPPPPPPKTQTWVDAFAMVSAGNNLLAGLDKSDTPETIATLRQALREAIDKFDDIPF